MALSVIIMEPITQKELDAFNKGLTALQNKLKMVVTPFPTIEDGRIVAKLNLSRLVEEEKQKNA